jgi:hypothetical protein
MDDSDTNNGDNQSMGSKKSVDLDEWDLDLEAEVVDLQLDLTKPIEEVLRMYHGEEEIIVEVVDDKEDVSFEIIANQSQYSIIHDLLVNKEIVFLSLDLEHCGYRGGIIQFSCELIRPGNTNECPCFDRYVKPHQKAVWDNRLYRVHGLTRTSNVIVNADPIEKVWHEFTCFFQSNIKPNEKCVLVAWCGQLCDLIWLYRLTKTKEYNLNMPEQIEYFMDPMLVIKAHKKCKLNPLATKEENIKLGTMYEYMFNEPIENAHNSLADVKAQTRIIKHDDFLPFIDRTTSIKKMDDIWALKIKRKRRLPVNLQDKCQLHGSLMMKWKHGNLQLIFNSMVQMLQEHHPLQKLSVLERIANKQ